MTNNALLTTKYWWELKRTNFMKWFSLFNDEQYGRKYKMGGVCYTTNCYFPPQVYEAVRHIEEKFWGCFKWEVEK